MSEFYQVFKIELDNEMRANIAKQVGKQPKDVTEFDVRKVIRDALKNS